METIIAMISRVFTSIAKPNDKSMIQVYKLRYQVFCKKLGWIEGDPYTESERDIWDDKDNVVHFQVKVFGRVLGYTRLLYGNLDDVMLGHDFHPLLPKDPTEIKEVVHSFGIDSFEITRLCISSYVPRWTNFIIVTLLYSAMKRWGKKYGYNRSWAVCSMKVALYMRSVGSLIGYDNFTLVSSGYMPGDENEYVVVFADSK